MTDRTDDSRRGLALGAMAVVVVAWGSGPVLVRSITVSAPTIIFWRLWLALPVVLTVAYLTGGRLSLKLLRQAVSPGILFGLSVLFSFASFRKTSIVDATLIPALQPVLVLLVASRWFGEQRTRTELLYAALAMAGTVVVVLGADGSGTSLAGDLLAVGNLLVFTGYFLLTKHARVGNVHPWSFIAAIMLVGALTCTPWALITTTDLGQVSARDWGLIVLLILGPGVLGHGLMTWVHRYLDVTLSSLLALGNPLVATIGAWAFLGQSLGVAQIFGAMAVLVALGAIVSHQRGVRALGAEAAATGDLLDYAVPPPDLGEPETDVESPGRDDNA